MLTGDRLFFIAACVLSVLAGIFAVTVVGPNLTTSLAVAAAFVVLVWLLRLDWWRKFYALTMILMVGAGSTIAPLVAISGNGRYAASGLLFLATWHTTRKIQPVYKSRLQKRFLKMLWFTVVLAGISTIWSEARLDTALQTVALFFLVGTVHMLTTRRWTDRATMTKDLSVGVAVLTVAFLASLATLVIGYAESHTIIGHRFQGIFNNPNLLALIAAVTIPLAWGLYRERPSIIRVLIILPAAAALLLSESRTSIAAVVVAFVWLALKASTSAKLGVLYATICAGLIMAVSGFNPFATSLERFGDLEGGDALNGRAVAWEQAIRLTIEQPIGYGWQAGRQLFESLHGVSGFDFTRTSVHNSYLQFLLELGVIAIIPLWYFILTAFLIIIRGENRKLSAGLVGTILVGLIVQFSESAMFGTGQPYPYIFWFATAGALTLYEQIPKKEPRKTKLPIHYQRLARRRERELTDAGRTSDAT